jgi:hypothetical protein
MLAILERLSKYPHVQTRLDIMWGTKECRDYLYQLIVPDRDGRAGFPVEDLDVINDIMRLHDQYYPQYIPNPMGWDVI